VVKGRSGIIHRYENVIGNTLVIEQVVDESFDEEDLLISWSRSLLASIDADLNFIYIINRRYEYMIPRFTCILKTLGLEDRYRFLVV